MKPGLILGILGLAVVGTGVAVVAASSKTGSKGKLKVGGMVMPGYNVGQSCNLLVHDLVKARATAYDIGLAGPTYDEAKARVFGGCGQQAKIQLKNESDVRNLYFLGYELLRGAIDGGFVTRAFADTLISDALTEMANYGISAAGLPTTFP